MKKNQISSLNYRPGSIVNFPGMVWDWLYNERFKGLINDKARKAASLPKFLDTITCREGDWQIMLLTVVVEKQY